VVAAATALAAAAAAAAAAVVAAAAVAALRQCDTKPAMLPTGQQVRPLTGQLKRLLTGLYTRC
jgi:hypothetical protein